MAGLTIPESEGSPYTLLVCTVQIRVTFSSAAARSTDQDFGRQVFRNQFGSIDLPEIRVML